MLTLDAADPLPLAAGIWSWASISYALLGLVAAPRGQPPSQADGFHSARTCEPACVSLPLCLRPCPGQVGAVTVARPHEAGGQVGLGPGVRHPHCPAVVALVCGGEARLEEKPLLTGQCECVEVTKWKCGSVSHSVIVCPDLFLRRDSWQWPRCMVGARTSSSDWAATWADSLSSLSLGFLLWIKVRLWTSAVIHR